jgi:hypothetical protein
VEAEIFTQISTSVNAGQRYSVGCEGCNDGAWIGSHQLMGAERKLDEERADTRFVTNRQNLLEKAF